MLELNRMNQMINQGKLDELMVHLNENCNPNDAVYQNYMGEIFYSRRDLQKAMYYADLASKQEYVAAFTLLGFIHNDLKDYRKAFECFKQTEKMNDEVGQLNEAICYYKGIGTNVDYNEAYKRFIHFPQYPISNLFLGLVHYIGIIVEKVIVL